jgi:hypothetical protein
MNKKSEFLGWGLAFFVIIFDISFAYFVAG